MKKKRETRSRTAKGRNAAIDEAPVAIRADLGTQASAWDRKATLLWMPVALMLSNTPYFFGLSLAGEHQVFTSLLFDDTFSYIAKMHVGYDGHWHYINRYTTEPVQPSLLFIFYVVLGHFAKWFGLGLAAAYHLARIAGAVALMFAVRRLIRCVGLSAWGAFGAFVLCFSVTAFSEIPLPVETPMPMERFISEAYCFLSIMHFPHFAFSTALLVLIMSEFIRLAENKAQAGSIALIGAASFAMAWIHPRLLLTGGLVGWVLASFIIIRGKLLPWRLAAGGAAFAICGGIASMLLAGSYRGDPFLKFWASITTFSPHPVVVLFGYGLLLPMAMVGGRQAWRQKTAGTTLLVLWTVAGFGLCYYPSGFQRRMFQGMDVPLALLAGVFIGRMTDAPPRKISRILTTKLRIAAAILLIATVGLWPALWRYHVTASKGTFPWYMSEDQIHAMEWLGRNTPHENVVLTGYVNGQAIPAISGNRVYMGHWAETFNRPEKAEEFEKFRNPDTKWDWRAEFLAEHDIRYFFLSGLELAAMDEAPGQNPYNPMDDTDHWRVLHAEPSLDQAKVVILERKGVGTNLAPAAVTLPTEGNTP